MTIALVILNFFSICYLENLVDELYFSGLNFEFDHKLRKLATRETVDSPIKHELEWRLSDIFLENIIIKRSINMILCLKKFSRSKKAIQIKWDNSVYCVTYQLEIKFFKESLKIVSHFFNKKTISSLNEV
ncbi:hypothetical protein BpHYR1_039541 [Brachionus plicatilis]|uniref:Uncharacterized protein n=1 Tax=Brachionus plicatilis TaxID=10195 RepID=A0A3M7SS96_BRAPC|nr:hypothetical protein BpHYR1_039541 [Brachionus plicatilis]